MYDGWLYGAGCYDDEGYYLEDCNCHESCYTCGFGEDPTEDTDCASCMSGTLTALYDDGTGYCEECVDGDGVDSFGDGCEWYNYNQDGCGYYDTSDFVAADECCICDATYTYYTEECGPDYYDESEFYYDYDEDTGDYTIEIDFCCDYSYDSYYDNYDYEYSCCYEASMDYDSEAQEYSASYS